jgi:hypothetical protein
MARRKPSDTIVELERGMTPKQVKLARALAAGGIPKVEAYRQVYGWKGKSANALQVAATKACQNDKVSILATSLRETESARLWEDKDRFRNWIMKGITDTAANTESDITRLKALELAGKTRFASVFEEPQANEANAAVAGSLVDLIGARLQSLLGIEAPTLGEGETVDTTCDPVPLDATTPTDTPTGGGEGD